jgi:hypothetical protein
MMAGIIAPPGADIVAPMEWGCQAGRSQGRVMRLQGTDFRWIADCRYQIAEVKTLILGKAADDKGFFSAI